MGGSGVGGSGVGGSGVHGFSLPPDRISSGDPEIDETWAVVCRLPFRQRAVLTLRFYEDLSEADIGPRTVRRPAGPRPELASWIRPPKRPTALDYSLLRT